MSFSLETTDMDLGDTPIENIFINDYMPMADGTYVKVYLLGYKYAHDRDMNIEVNNETISRHLDIPMEDVLRAWDFWEEKGIIKKIYGKCSLNYQVKFLNLKQLYIKNNINIFSEENKEEIEREEVRKESDIKEFIEANKIPEINEMFNNIDYIIRRQTTPTEKKKIYSWLNDYNMTPEVIEKAFSYSVEVMGKKRLNYVEAVVRNWYDEGLTNIEDVMEVFKNNDKRYYEYLEVQKALGLHRRPVKNDEKEIMDEWFDEKGHSLELVLAACERDLNPTPSIRYVNGILKSWEEKGIKKVEDIEELDTRENKAASTNSKKIPYRKTRFHNFKQRSDKYTSDELEEVVERKRDEKIRRILEEK